MSPTTISPNDMPLLDCDFTSECSNITGAICNASRCICPETAPVFIAEKFECMKAANLSAACLYDQQCLNVEPKFSTCGADNLCTCIKGYKVQVHLSVGVNCVAAHGRANPVDPTMMGVLVGLALMFIIICVVLRLFSKARFRENRSIFNTPNPRLMNASLFKDRRRGSVVSNTSGRVGTPGAASGRNQSPTPEAPKGGGISPTKNSNKEDSTVAIETVD